MFAGIPKRKLLNSQKYSKIESMRRMNKLGLSWVKLS